MPAIGLEAQAPHFSEAPPNEVTVPFEFSRNLTYRPKPSTDIKVT
jgi:hypothetical protein